MFGFEFFEVLKQKNMYDREKIMEYKCKDYIEKNSTNKFCGFNLRSTEYNNIFFSQKIFYKQLLNLNNNFFFKNLFGESFFIFFFNLNNLKKKRYFRVKKEKEFRYKFCLTKKKSDILFLKGSFFFKNRYVSCKRKKKAFFFFNTKMKKFNKYFFFLFENFFLFKRILFIDKLNLENNYFGFLKINPLRNLMFNGLYFSRLFFKYIQKFSREKYFKFRCSKEKYSYFFIKNYFTPNRKKGIISQEYLTSLLDNGLTKNIMFNLSNSPENFIMGSGRYVLDSKIDFFINNENLNFLKKTPRRHKKKKSGYKKWPYKLEAVTKELGSVKKKFINFIKIKSVLESKFVYNKKLNKKVVPYSFKNKFKKISCNIYENNYIDLRKNLKKKLRDIFYGKLKKKLAKNLRKKIRKLIKIKSRKKKLENIKLSENLKKNYEDSLIVSKKKFLNFKAIQRKNLIYSLYSYKFLFKFRRYYNYLNYDIKNFFFDNEKNKIKKRNFKKFNKIKKIFLKKYYNIFLKKENFFKFFKDEKKYIKFLRLFIKKLYLFSEELYKNNLFKNKYDNKIFFFCKRYKLNLSIFKNIQRNSLFTFVEKKTKFITKRRRFYFFGLKIKNSKIEKLHYNKKNIIVKKFIKKMIKKKQKFDIEKKNIKKKNKLEIKIKYKKIKVKLFLNKKIKNKFVINKKIIKCRIKKINEELIKKLKKKEKNKIKMKKYFRTNYPFRKESFFFNISTGEVRVNQLKLKIKDELIKNIFLIKHLKNQLKYKLNFFNILKKRFIKQSNGKNLFNEIENVLFFIRCLKLKLRNQLGFQLILKKGLVLCVILKRISLRKKNFFNDFFGKSLKRLINENYHFLESLENFLDIGFCKEIFKNNLEKTLKRIYGKTNLLYKFYGHIKSPKIFSFYFLRNNKKEEFDKKKEDFGDENWICHFKEKRIIPYKKDIYGFFDAERKLKFRGKFYISYLRKTKGSLYRPSIKRKFYLIKFFDAIYFLKKKKLFKKVHSILGLKKNKKKSKFRKLKKKKRGRVLTFLKKGLFPDNFSFFNFQLFLLLWKKFNIYFFFKMFFFKFFFLFYCRKLLLNSLTKISNNFLKLKFEFLILKNYLKFIFFKQINFNKINLFKKNNVFFNFFFNCNLILKNIKKIKKKFYLNIKRKKHFILFKKIRLKKKWLIFKSNIKFLLIKSLTNFEFLKKYKVKNFYLIKKKNMIKNGLLKVFGKSKLKFINFKFDILNIKKKNNFKNNKYKFNNFINEVGSLLYFDYNRENRFKQFSSLFFKNNNKMLICQKNLFNMLNKYYTYFSFSKISDLFLSKINKIQNKNIFYDFDWKFLIKKSYYFIKNKFIFFRLFFKVKSKLFLVNIKFFYNLICNIYNSNLFFFFKNFLTKIKFCFNFLKTKFFYGFNIILIFFNKILKMDFLNLFYSIKYFMKTNLNLKNKFKLKNNNKNYLSFNDNINLKNIIKYKFIKFFEKKKNKKLYSKTQKNCAVNILRKKTNKIIKKNIQFNIKDKDLENEKFSMFNSKKLVKTFKKIFYIIMSRTFNNVFISIIRRNGKLLIKSSNGMLGFKGPTRLTEMASKENLKALAKKILFKFKGFKKLRMRKKKKKVKFNIQFLKKKQVEFNKNNNSLKKKIKQKKYDINFLKKTRLKSLFSSANLKELNLKYRELNKALRYRIKSNRYGKYFFFDKKKVLKFSLKKVMNSVKKQDTILNFFVFIKGYFFKRSVRSAIYHLRFFNNRDLRVLRIVSTIKKPFNGCRMKKIRRA